MTKLREVYKCEICGNIVEVLHIGQGELVCCGQPMQLQVEHVEDVGLEKHMPVLNKEGENILVKVGEIPHPMEDEHYIEWIEILFQNGKSCKNFLKPNDMAETSFCNEGEVKELREYCNMHGLWVNKF